jgi:hypothetical protein
MKSSKLSFVSSILLFAALCAWSDEQLKIAPVFSGYASFEESEMVKGYLNLAYKPSRAPFRRLCGWKTPKWASDRQNRRRRTSSNNYRLSKETGIFTDHRLQPQTKVIYKPSSLIGILRFNGEKGLYSFGDPQNPFLQIEAGYFPYKYNPDVRNLGEYLFRSFCYPASLLNTFDRPYADLLGLRIGNAIPLSGGSFHHDLLFTSETKYYPLKDFSLSYVADYSIAGDFQRWSRRKFISRAYRFF